MSKIAKVGVLGASGYTGSECVRLLLRHPRVEVALLTADRKAGQEMREVFPQFSPFPLPKLVPLEGFDWATVGLDLVFCALPHATTQKVVKDLVAKAPHIRVVDLSADFRLADPAAYQRWYGHEHHAPELQKEAVYGLVEFYRERIRKGRLIANPGCYTTCAQLPLVPLIKTAVIDVDEVVVDAKSGMTGAGRAAKEHMLFSEVAEGFHAYGVGHHRHMAELDQELSLAAGRSVTVTFTPHLVPMNRGILSTIYVRGVGGRSPQDLHAILLDTYRAEAFVHVLPFGEMPQTRHVRGSNMTFIGVAADRIKGRAVIAAALEQLVKGAFGKAACNMNVVQGF
jgi:N-acetyl-gamma-glutamyl-phosphate reductase